MQRIGWAPPEASNPVRKRNYRAIRLDSAAMGVVNAASIFMPVFIVRLGGSNLEVSLLTALPALAGFLLAIPIGTFLQARRNIVPWYAVSRGFAQLVYAATAIAVAIVAGRTSRWWSSWSCGASSRSRRRSGPSPSTSSWTAWPDRAAATTCSRCAGASWA